MISAFYNTIHENIENIMYTSFIAYGQGTNIKLNKRV